jgi:PAS domain S-box-containing protein
VVITEAGDEQTSIAVLKAGADDYVVKGGNYLARLALTLEHALQRFRAEAARRARCLKVLYVEHSHLDIDLIQRHLGQHAPHIQLDVVTTGPEALQWLPQDGSRGLYDIMLLDSRLPQLGALDVLKELRQVRGLDLPVVLLTGQGDDEVARQAVKLGALSYITSYIIKTPGYLELLPEELESALNRVELIRGQQALICSEARFRTLVENLPVGVMICGAQGEITLCNQAATAMLGVPAAQLLGKTWHNQSWGARYEDDSLYTEVTHPVTQAIATGRPVLDATMRLAARIGGDSHWLLVHAVPWLGPAGKVEQVLLHVARYH